jgi:hypothetical protein
MPCQRLDLPTIFRGNRATLDFGDENRRDAFQSMIYEMSCGELDLDFSDGSDIMFASSNDPTSSRQMRGLRIAEIRFNGGIGETS